MAQPGRAGDYFLRWQHLLAGPQDALIELMCSDSEEAKALRQCTPFAGALPPRERWALWRSVRRELEGK